MVTMGEGQAGSMPITLSWQVTMSTDMVPHLSWPNWLINRVDPTTWVRACFSISSGGVWGDWLPQRILAMSTNPGRGACSWAIMSSGGVSTLGLEVASGSSVRVAMGFGHPAPLIGPNAPLTQALQLLLELCSRGWRLGGLFSSWWGYPHQVRWGNLTENLLVSEHGEGLHGLPQFSNTFCQLAWLSQGWQFGFLNPVL